MAMQENRVMGAMEGGSSEAEEKHEPTEQEKKETAAFAEFENRIAEIRGSLSKEGHLELVADGRFSIEKKELISKVGAQRATRYLNDFFSKNSVN